MAPTGDTEELGAHEILQQKHEVANAALKEHHQLKGMRKISNEEQQWRDDHVDLAAQICSCMPSEINWTIVQWDKPGPLNMKLSPKQAWNADTVHAPPCGPVDVSLAAIAYSATSTQLTRLQCPPRCPNATHQPRTMVR